MDSEFKLPKKRDKRSSLSLKKKRHRRRMMRKQFIILSMAVLVFGVVFMIGKHYITRERNFASAEIETNADDTNQDNNLEKTDDVQPQENTSDENEDTESNQDDIDNTDKEQSGQAPSGNGGYIALEDDPNAEDVMEVFHTTESLLKGTSKYPVRTDNKKVVYLTFDDGPSTENTGNVLDTLNKYGVKATFFVTGKSIDASSGAKDLLKRIASEGHAIGNHTYSHDYKKLYPGRNIDANAFMADVEKCNESMKNVLGQDFSTRVIRFPGGYWSWNGRSNIRPIIDEKGYAIMDWNTLNEDAQGAVKDAAKLVETTKTNVEKLGPDADSIVFLMHDTYGKSETAKALPQIIEYFQSLGFEFKSMK